MVALAWPAPGASRGHMRISSAGVPAYPGRPARSIPLLAPAIIALAVVGSALLSGRHAAARVFPPLASVFERAGLASNAIGFELRDVRASLVTEAGGPALAIEGEIRNIRSATRDAPDLRFVVRAPDGRELYSWTGAPSEPKIRGGGVARFKARLASPPRDGGEVLVRFARASAADQ